MPKAYPKKIPPSIQIVRLITLEFYEKRKKKKAFPQKGNAFFYPRALFTSYSGFARKGKKAKRRA